MMGFVSNLLFVSFLVSGVDLSLAVPFTCEGQALGAFGCANCATMIICGGSDPNAPTPSENPCSFGQVCDDIKGTCAATPAGSCECTAAGYVADGIDDPSQWYRFCTSVGGAAYILKCSDGQTYDGTAKACVDAPDTTTAVAPPECTEMGVFGLDCSSYYTCFPQPPDYTTLVPGEVTTCDPVSTPFFDSSTGLCVANLPTNTLTCESGQTGGIMDDLECNAFRLCSSGTVVDAPKICCSAGERFNVDTNLCAPESEVPDSACPVISECAVQPSPDEYMCLETATSSSSSSSSASTSTSSFSSSTSSSTSSGSTSSSTSSGSGSASSSTSSGSGSSSTSSGSGSSSTSSDSGSSSTSSGSGSSSTSSGSTSSSSSSDSTPSSSSSGSSFSSSSSGSTISSSSSSSTSSSTATTALCSQDGYFPYPGDCTRYYSCGGGNYVIQECLPNMYFDPENQYCDLKENVPSCA